MEWKVYVAGMPNFNCINARYVTYSDMTADEVKEYIRKEYPDAIFNVLEGVIEWYAPSMWTCKRR